MERDYTWCRTALAALRRWVRRQGGLGVFLWAAMLLGALRTVFLTQRYAAGPAVAAEAYLCLALPPVLLCGFAMTALALLNRRT